MEAFRAQWESHSCPTFLLWSERRRNDDPSFPLCRNKVQILCMTKGNQQEALENLFSCRKIQLSLFVSFQTQTEEFYWDFMKRRNKQQSREMIHRFRSFQYIWNLQFLPLFTLRPPNKLPDHLGLHVDYY